MSRSGKVFYSGELPDGSSGATTAVLYSLTGPNISHNPGPRRKLDIAAPRRTVQSAVFAPIFSGMLAEGSLKDLQCLMLRIDPNDEFTRLLKTAGTMSSAQ